MVHLNLDLLRRLTFFTATVAPEHSPALAYLQTGQAISGSKVEVHQIQNGLVTFTGALSLDDRARIYNWFSRFAPGAARAKSKRLQRVPIAHAIALLILEKNKESLLQDKTFTSGKIKDQ